MPYPLYRRWFGLLFGAITGFAFALISQGMDHVLMPGVPLYQPPFGAPGNILLFTCIGTALGAATAWAESGGASVLWSSLLGALFMAIATMLSGRNEDVSWAHRAAAIILIFLPTAGALAVPLIVFRWIISREEQAYRDTHAWLLAPRQTLRWKQLLQRLAVPSGMVLLAAAIGMGMLYNDLGRSVIPQMHQMIQQGIQAGSLEALPASFQPPDVERFLERAREPYTLQWDKDEKNQFAIPRPAGNAGDQSTVIARFANGYLLACMFPGKTGAPTCRDY